MCPTAAEALSPLAPAEIDDGSWWQEVLSAGSMTRVEWGQGGSGWSLPPPGGVTFMLRAPGFFSGQGGRKGTKAPASPPEDLLQLVAVDWLRSDERLDHVLARDDSQVAVAFRRAGEENTSLFILAVNLQVQENLDPQDAYSAVFYFAAEEPIPPESPLGRFIHGDDDYRSARFKVVTTNVKAPWWSLLTLQQIYCSSATDTTAYLVGRKITCHYYRGDNYLEIDVDIGSSKFANDTMLNLLNYKSMSVDIGFLIESKCEEELPERLFGAVRVACLDKDRAKYVKGSPHDAMPADTPAPEEDPDPVLA